MHAVRQPLHSVIHEFEASLPVRLVDTDSQFAVGMTCRWLVTATAACDDFREEYTDIDMDFGC